MDIFSELKKIRSIKPSAEFSQKSKLVILSSPQLEPKPSLSRLVFMSSLRFGSALVLTSVVIILIVSGFAIGRPGDDLVSGLDIRSLRAEAQAIDIQIRLTDLGYSGITSVESLENGIIEAPKGAEDKNPKPASSIEELGVTTEVGDDGRPSSSTKSLTIEDVLEKLSE